MSASLIISLKRIVPVDDVLQRTKGVLLKLLNIDAAPSLHAELPPRLRDAKHLPVLRNRLVDISFPGAYVKFEGNDESVVDFHVFEGGSGSTNLMVGCGSVSTPDSDLLTAALAAAFAELMEATILDAGTYWMHEEEASAQELVEQLRLREEQRDFAAAVKSFHATMEVCRRRAKL